ncbi:LysR family transcriptional regulator [Domibacillus robiginosus]|uniref:LysR family transcriptional regulator n=1 Tax=Domibacillus robiginosus TaxID=1071054 RepID=UPI00067E1E13|nr:LysR family transcriptional regulator [Domibacillus robiginosus]
MDYRDWEIIKALYEHKNITKTAHSFFLTQPALTSRLKLMERELDIKIIAARNKKGIHLTPQGEYLATEADEALSLYREIKENILNMNGEIRGTLRIGASNFFTKYKLPLLLKKFKEQYPLVEFKVRTGWSSDIMKALYNKDIHIGFVRGDYSWRDQKHLLFEETLCIASIDKLEIDQLPFKRRIEYKSEFLLKLLIDNWWVENYSASSLTSIKVNRVDTCKEMVLNGIGYGILPSMILEGEEALHKIILKDKQGEAILRRTWMYSYKGWMELKIVKAFVEFIEREFFNHTCEQ